MEACDVAGQGVIYPADAFKVYPMPSMCQGRPLTIIRVLPEKSINGSYENLWDLLFLHGGRCDETAPV
jgi:hypothetical protein